MSAGRTIFKNFLSLTFSNAVSRASGLITVIYLARVLGPAEFGKMNFAMALTGYFATLAHLGLGTIGIRELAQAPGDRDLCVSRILSLKVLLGTGAFALLCLVTLLLKEPSDVKWLVVFYGLTMFTTNVLSFDWVFQGIEKMEYLGFAGAAQGVAYLAAIALSIKGSGDLLLIPWLLLGAQACAVAFMWLAYRRLFPGSGLRFVRPENLEKLRQALPIALWGILTVIILNSGITILGFLRPPGEVGYFSAAYKVTWIIVETLIAYIAAVFPSMAKHHALSPEKFSAVLDRTLKLATLFCLPAMAGLYMLSVPVTALVYGSKFGEAASILAFLAVLPYLIFITNLYSHALIAAHRQNKVLKLSAIQAALVVLLNLALIPAYGAKGLAAAAIIATAVCNYLYRLETGRFAKLGRFRPYKPLLATALMAGALRLAAGQGLLVTVPLGVVVYAAAILLLREVTLEELRGLRTLFRPEAQGRER
ncbi:MAG: flippase [Elusimicrobiales bacterium]|nr:flippase [Elusimicrobiales bacterium]